MNTIFAQIEDCCYFWLEKVKLFGIYQFATILTLITMELVLMNCYMTVGIKEKERNMGKISIIIIGKYHPKKF